MRVGPWSAGKKYASSVDVARMAGVSQSAVSRTFSGGANVSDGTRKKVLDAAKQLDYRPSLIPRIMLTHKSNLVAIVVGGLYNPFYSAVLEQFTIKFQAVRLSGPARACRQRPRPGRRSSPSLPAIGSMPSSALLAILSPSAAQTLAKLKIPVISFNTAVKNEWVTLGVLRQCRRRAARSPIFSSPRDARSFGFISGPGASHASAGRLKGFQDGCTN